MNKANNPTWPAAAAFDQIADRYDEIFTRSMIGRAQRLQVWRRLVRTFPRRQRILEINCGTGEDALFLGRRGRTILACDASPAMIEVAETRRRVEAAEANVEFRVLANEELATLNPQAPFDGAFSNFSGLNCLADLQPIAQDLAALIRPGGRLLLCLSSRVCIGEWLWYLMHGQKKKAFRRVSGQATARFGEITISVSYPRTEHVREAFAPWFRLESRRAVGLFVPPSYGESWARRHRKILALLEQMDRQFAGWPVLRDAGDHVLMEFVKCQN